MAASGFLLVFVVGTYTASAPPSPSRAAFRQNPEAVYHVAEDGRFRETTDRISDSPLPVRIMDALSRITGKAASLLSGEGAENGDGFEPSVIRYNLVSLYPEEEELSADDETISRQDLMIRLLKHNVKPLYDFFNIDYHTRAYDSYGGRMYEYLNRKDAEWVSQLYGWIQASPEQAAALKQLPTEAVTGKYDPTNENHDPANPATWTIPSWKNVNFNFLDGDGRSIELFSNAKEILSMASVHTWYSGWRDVDCFKEYINDLWRFSHSYGVSIGPVYYCEGCVDPKEPKISLNGPLGDEGGDSSSKDSSEANRADLGDLTVDSSTDTSEGQDGGLQALEEPPAAASPSELTGPSDEIAAKAGTGQKTAGEQEEEGADESGADLSPLPDVQLNSEGKFCPGHVDLSVTARIIGLSGNKNLYQIDRKGGVKTDIWPGWSPYNMAYVNELNGQDWEMEYNLPATSPAFGKPLTFAEINEYLLLLPEDISRERKAVITYALHSVGKIPYYYGGKARIAGYEGNQFASITRPDRKGRILSGLDCSGWVNWVYLSSLGSAPTSMGTSGLAHAGRAVSRAQLKPGDLIIRLGANSHVVMFLAWAPGDQMIGIHETGGDIGNVTVSVMDAKWPYYRALLD